MKKIKLILAFAISLLFSVNAQAGGGYTGNGQIEFMQSAYGGWIMRLSAANSNPDGCSKDNILLLPSHHSYEEIYAMLLVAYSSGNEINVHVSGCADSGHKIFNFIFTAWNS